MTTVTTQLVRANSSKVAKRLEDAIYSNITEIIVGERPAPRSEGWVETHLTIDHLDEINYCDRVYYKTATLYGRSRMYFNENDRNIASGIYHYIIDNNLPYDELESNSYENDRYDSDGNYDVNGSKSYRRKLLKTQFGFLACSINSDQDDFFLFQNYLDALNKYKELEAELTEIENFEQ